MRRCDLRCYELYQVIMRCCVLRRYELYSDYCAAFSPVRALRSALFWGAGGIGLAWLRGVLNLGCVGGVGWAERTAFEEAAPMDSRALSHNSLK